MVRLALVLLVCAACFADSPPSSLGSGSSGAGTAMDATTGMLPASTGEATQGGGSGASATGTTGSTGSAVTGGTTGPETTAGSSTGGEPGTSTGATSDGGTTGPLMWDDCKQFDTEADCVGCCAEVIDASKVYYSAFAGCLCLQGNPCMQTCGLDLCFFGQVSAACLECAAGPGAVCQNTAIAKCQDDPDCGAFLECTAENQCNRKL